MMVETVRLFVGYDPDEALAFSVFAHSVHRRASVPVSVQPVMLSQLRGVFNRPREEPQSTEFAISRFLVPSLCDYEGWAIFADGDMICRADIAELWALRDERYAVMVVKHDYETKEVVKFLGRRQMSYAKKNWSSVMLFNNCRCRALVPGYVQEMPGLDLHQFRWLPEDGLDIGMLPAAWNHLIGVDAPDNGAKIAHFTLGLPFWRGYGECEFANEWREERDAMMSYAKNGW